ncbi:hypothetical protein [Oceanobacillus sp. J11TS1]|uniref:hypothetical protein n=1 Tax=Oceanobacillus sp. J11TS1 TaxID=2807191 RepID=UPI001B0F78FD|nr:hypothetical protein [Oceanobacillus sp. J11TS1]GIO23780.1 hypothetical protein J11TS1_23610 [Oceanobacillus sp. J11TS1]
MKKKSIIVLITIAIIGFGIFTYYSYPTDADKGTDSIVTDKNGEVVEPLDEDNNNMGH